MHTSTTRSNEDRNGCARTASYTPSKDDGPPVAARSNHAFSHRPRYAVGFSSLPEIARSMGATPGAAGRKEGSEEHQMLALPSG